MKSKNELLSSMALLVITSQATERILKFVLVFVLQDGTPLSAERMTELEGRFDRKTLGYLLRELKGRAIFEPSMLALMDEFLKQRNEMIHRFYEADIDLESAEGLKKLDSYLAAFHHRNWTLMKFLISLCKGWAEQIGFPTPLFSAITDPGFQKEILEMEALIPEIIKEN